MACAAAPPVINSGRSGFTETPPGPTILCRETIMHSRATVGGSCRSRISQGGVRRATGFRRVLPVLFVAFAALAASAAPARCDDASDAAAAHAGRILGFQDVRAGLAVQAECGDGSLLVALKRGGAGVVQGLASDARLLEEARSCVRGAKLYGPVSVVPCDMKRLPYVDGLVNLFICDDYGSIAAKGADIGEILRVLAPYGTAFLKGYEGAADGATLSRADGWVVVRKPRQPGTDEWTHFDHDPQRSSVSRDVAFDLPNGVRWISGMVYPYSMDDVAFASTGGRNFYWYWSHHVARYGPRAERSRIVCADSFSGVELWSKELEKRPHGPSFVALDNRLYMDRGGPDGLVAIDAASGEEVFAFRGAGVHPSAELFVEDGILLQSAAGLRAFDAGTGEKLWAKETGLATTDMALIGEGSLFYLHKKSRQDPLELVRCDLKTGEEAWRVEPNIEHADINFVDAPGLLSYHKGVLFVSNTSRLAFSIENGALYALSAQDGRRMWEFKYDVVGHKGIPVDVFPIGNKVWVKTRGQEVASHGRYVALDLMTGEPGGSFPVGYNRCYPDRASTRYLLTGTFDFVDMPSGTTHEMWVARGHCNTGFMVAQGFTYSFPVRCMCLDLVRGFLALGEAAQPGVGESAPAVNKGPAFGFEPGDAVPETDWPTFRCRGNRNNATPAGAPRRLAEKWRTRVDGQPTSLSAAAGMVFVALPETHRVAALDADTGAVKWYFTAGGRVDSPPTYYRGLILFGSADGRVYCLRAGDGQLVWSLRASPADLSIQVRGQVESVWPVPGSVLVSDGVLFFAAGRNTNADGGLRYCAADPATGEIKWSLTAGREHRESTNDVLVRGEQTIHLGHRIHFAPETGQIARYGGGDPVVFGPLGLLTDCLTNGPVAREDILRRQWGYGRVAIGGRPRQAQHGVRKCAIVAVDASGIYGGAEDYVFDWENNRVWDRTLRLIRDDHENKPVWEVDVDPGYLLRAIVAAKDALLVSAHPSQGGQGEIWTVSRDDGSRLEKVAFDGTPRWDGLAVAGGKVFAVTDEGDVICLGN